MGLFDISSADTTNLSTTLTETSIDTKDTSFSLYTPNWIKWHGIYREIGRLQSAIDKTAFWAAGKGIKAKEQSKQKQLDAIRGNGKDTIRDIVINQMRTSSICGASFAEIIKNKRAELINLKPLSPGTMEVVGNSKGMVIEFNQITWKDGGRDKQNKIILQTWQPEEIFYLPLNRIADEIGGISTIEKIEDNILKRKEAANIMQIIVKRCAKPLIIIEVDTDNTTKMTEIKTKYKTMIDNGEAMVVPKDAVKFLDLASKMGIDFMPWLSYLDKEFLIAEGVPEVIMGAIAGKEAEGASKILYLAWEQVVKNKQDWFEEQWKAQIGFEIDLPEPPSIDPMVLTDSRKAGSMNAGKGNDRVSDTNPAGQNK